MQESDLRKFLAEKLSAAIDQPVKPSLARLDEMINTTQKTELVFIPSLGKTFPAVEVNGLLRIVVKEEDIANPRDIGIINKLGLLYLIDKEVPRKYPLSAPVATLPSKRQRRRNRHSTLHQ